MTSMKLAAAVVPLLLLLMASSSLSKQFDFYYFVQMWPGAYCAQTKAGCCLPKSGPTANDFFVSGLWTYNATSGKAVTKCPSNSVFNINELGYLRPELNQYWSSIKCPSTDAVSPWESAWKKYGVCADKVVASYFENALDLRNKANLLDIFNGNGITPSKPSSSIANQLTVYKLSFIEAAIQAAIGVKPIIQCRMTPEQIFQVFQVLLCVDVDGKTFIECPFKLQYTCSQYVMFNPFDTSYLKPPTSADAEIKMPLQG